jgi:hypothetical protein
MGMTTDERMVAQPSKEGGKRWFACKMIVLFCEWFVKIGGMFCCSPLFMPYRNLFLQRFYWQLPTTS